MAKNTYTAKFSNDTWTTTTSRTYQVAWRICGTFEGKDSHVGGWAGNAELAEKSAAQWRKRGWNGPVEIVAAKQDGALEKDHRAEGCAAARDGAIRTENPYTGDAADQWTDGYNFYFETMKTLYSTPQAY